MLYKNNSLENQKKALNTWLTTLPALDLSSLRSTAPDYIVNQANDEQPTKGDVSLYVWGAFLLQPNK